MILPSDSISHHHHSDNHQRQYFVHYLIHTLSPPQKKNENLLRRTTSLVYIKRAGITINILLNDVLIYKNSVNDYVKKMAVTAESSHSYCHIFLLHY